MNSISLYMAPGTCARVPCIALEEIGVEFETVVVRFARKEHKSADYRKLNPKGKVPTLIIDGEAISENVAILTYLDQRFPAAGLLPEAAGEFEKARQLADLCFCAATLHPLVARIRMPHLFAGQETAESVWQAGCEAMNEYFSLVEDRLARQSWWYGEAWSAMDAYLYWVYWRCAGADYDVGPYPNFGDHAARMETRPAVQRALAREDAAQKQLEAEGLAFSPPPRS